MTGDEQHDVVVIGGGAAGVSCALECFDIQLDTLLVEASPTLGGQLPEIPHSVRNVAAGHFDDGTALAQGLREAAAVLGDRARSATAVTGVDLAGRVVDSGDRTIAARALVIATGSELRQLPAAADGSFAGDVTYQLHGETARFSGRDVAVIGSGDSAPLDALEL